MSQSEFTGRNLIAAGYEPGPWFSKVLSEAQTRNLSISQSLKLAERVHQDWVAAQPVRVDLQDPIDFRVNITAETDYEQENMTAVLATFTELTRTPTVIAGAVMPDACPAGPLGTIPVGGVIGAKGAIHPGMHSADICCSMFVTVFDGSEPDHAMEAVAAIAHFGPGGRTDRRFSPDADLLERMRANPFFRGGKMMDAATSHFGSSGDGNHFANICVSGREQVALVTHFGSRGLGAMLYKAGMEVAERHRQAVAPDVLKGNAWIPSDSREGEDYWEALQIVRDWTKASHQALHDAVGEEIGATITRRLWNEHNFVFREDDVFWHAKGATPIHNGFLPDTDGVQIVPMNMREPILLVRGERNATNLGFAPHGAGRNMSRTAHKRLFEDLTDEEIFERETLGIDARFFSANIDISELPSAYKNAAAVQRDMERFGLCEVVERLEPYGGLMAGDWEMDAPWKRNRKTEEPENDPSPGM